MTWGRVQTWNMNVTKSTEHGVVEGEITNYWQSLEPRGLPYGVGMTVEVTPSLFLLPACKLRLPCTHTRQRGCSA